MRPRHEDGEPVPRCTSHAGVEPGRLRALQIEEAVVRDQRGIDPAEQIFERRAKLLARHVALCAALRIEAQTFRAGDLVHAALSG